MNLYGIKIPFQGTAGVYVRDDLFEKTQENLTRMLNGKAPIGIDGHPVNLHHVTQENGSALAEVGHTTHHKSPNNKILHGIPTKDNKVNREEFDKVRQAWWAYRGVNIQSK
jgi:filamentous hemagglutinin